MESSPAIKLISFMVSLRRLPPLSELTGEEERLLFELYEIWERSGEISVSDVYGLGHGKSASTAYRTFISLKDKGMVDVSVDDNDKRKREVSFTNIARQLFSAMG
jgi:DNA-binding MarR family transcriptional regulator